MRVEAAVPRGRDAVFELATLELGEPRPDEVLVRTVASGICHADLVAGGDPGVPKPIAPGHEGRGSSSASAPGDHVVLSFASCGGCSLCLAVRPIHAHCFGRPSCSTSLASWFGCSVSNSRRPSAPLDRM